MGVKTEDEKPAPAEEEVKEKKQVKMTEEGSNLMRKASRKGKASVAPELQGLLERDEVGDFDDEGFTLAPVQELPEPIADDLTDEEHLNEEVKVLFDFSD